MDVTLAGLQPALFRTAITALLDSPSFDAVVVIAGSSALADPGLVTGAVFECQGKSDKPLLVYVSPHAPHLVAMLNQGGVPAFSTPESCATVLAAMQPRPVPAIASPAAAPLDTTALPHGPLNEAESKQLFARFGVPCVRELVVANGDAPVSLGFDGPVVVKLLSRHVAHKSDVGGVKLGVAPAEVGATCRAMAASLQARGIVPEGFMVQEMVRGGVEMILGFHRDPQLGGAVLLGLGGVTAELFDDVAIRLLPIGRTDAEAMVGELKAHKLLTGFRGAPPGDIAALVDAVVAFAAMADQLGDRLVEAEINPLFVLPQGGTRRGWAGCAGVAASGRYGPPSPQARESRLDEPQPKFAHPVLTLVTCVLASSLAFIDGSVVNVALPAIEHSQGGGAEGLQWLVNGYLLPLSALLMFGGSLGDRFGRRRILVLGVTLFGVASIVCGLAPNLTVLLAARFAQGMGAALLMPCSLALLGAAFTGAARGRAIGIWAAAGAAMGAAGPVLGGLAGRHRLVADDFRHQRSHRFRDHPACLALCPGRHQPPPAGTGCARRDTGHSGTGGADLGTHHRHRQSRLGRAGHRRVRDGRAAAGRVRAVGGSSAPGRDDAAGDVRLPQLHRPHLAHVAAVRRVGRLAGFATLRADPGGRLFHHRGRGGVAAAATYPVRSVAAHGRPRWANRC